MRFAAPCLLLLAGLALAGGALAGGDPGTVVQADGEAAIVLRAAADLPGTRYTLGDIADIETTNAALRRRLAAIPIGAVPRRGYAESVTRDQVQARVRQKASLENLEWRGAAAVRVRGQGQRVKAEALFDAATAALYAVLSGRYESVRMQPVSSFEGINVPAGKLSLAARLPAGQRVSSRMSALVDVAVDGQTYTTTPVWFAVSAARSVRVARSGLRPGAALRAEDFEVRMVDLAESSALALPGDAPLEGMRLRRGLEAGAVLGAAQVESRPPVARDEQVAVQVVVGAVTIETTGRALADARVGEMVRVRSTRTDESFPARVVSDGVVVVGAR